MFWNGMELNLLIEIQEQHFLSSSCAWIQARYGMYAPLHSLVFYTGIYGD
jgi:hypothetical protein